MKTPNLLLCFCCLLTAILVAALARSSAQTLNRPLQAPAPAQAAPARSHPGAPYPLLLNSQTWQLTEMDGTPIAGEINSPKALWARYYAVLAAQNPQEYERIFPKSAETRAAIQNALNAAHHPKDLAQRLSEIRDPAQRAELQRSIDAILHPQPMTAETLRALDASPAGPWSNAMKPYPQF